MLSFYCFRCSQFAGLFYFENCNNNSGKSYKNAWWIEIYQSEYLPIHYKQCLYIRLRCEEDAAIFKVPSLSLLLYCDESSESLESMEPINGEVGCFWCSKTKSISKSLIEVNPLILKQQQQQHFVGKMLLGQKIPIASIFKFNKHNNMPKVSEHFQYLHYFTKY